MIRKLVYWLASWLGVFICIIWMIFITGQYVTGYAIGFISYLTQLFGGLILVYTVLIAMRRPVLGGIWLFAEGFTFIIFCRYRGMLTAPNLLNGLAPMVVALLFLISQRGYTDQAPFTLPEEKEKQFKFPE
jgi:hypothetical protein